MQAHLFLVGISFCAFILSGWYILQLNPHGSLNRWFAALSVFVALWSLLSVIIPLQGGASFGEAWSRHQRFSYFAKGSLSLRLVLAIVGRRPGPRARRAFLFLFGLSALICAAGIIDRLGPILGGKVQGAWALAVGLPLPWKAIYTAMTLPLFGASIILVGICAFTGPFYKDRMIARWYLGVGFVDVAANLVVGWLSDPSSFLAIDFLLLVQIAQPLIRAMAISHYKLMKPPASTIKEGFDTAVPYAVFVFDRTGQTLEVNPMAAELVGLPGKECIGRPASGIFPGQGGLPLDPARPSYLEFELGGTNLVGFSISPKLDPWGDCVGYIAIGQAVAKLAEVRQRCSLSAREGEVCLLLAEGLSNQDIAERLFISPGTVKNHIYNIYDKTGARNRVELARLVH